MTLCASCGHAAHEHGCPHLDDVGHGWQPCRCGVATWPQACAVASCASLASLERLIAQVLTVATQTNDAVRAIAEDRMEDRALLRQHSTALDELLARVRLLELALDVRAEPATVRERPPRRTPTPPPMRSPTPVPPEEG